MSDFNSVTYVMSNLASYGAVTGLLRLADSAHSLSDSM